ncbi:MAG: hypothetical protein KAJ63_15815 [Methyloprofundus sp.]|nr:hypothetical protein [Methyloprofundus sp.]
MQKIKDFQIIMAATLGIVLISTASHAAPKQIELPVEMAKLPESELPGYRLATQHCVICHSVDYIRYQPPGMSQAQWTAEVAKMKHVYGAAWLSEADIKSIGAYLAVVYGTAKATDRDVLTVSGEGQ